MTQLQNLLGEDGVRWALWGGIGLVALLSFLLIIIVLKRIFAPAFNLSSAADRRGRPPRLGVTDFFNLDRTGRRLVIVRRDNVEHLVMVGGPNDVVIETNIVRGLRPEIATVDSAGRPTVQPRQIDSGSSDQVPAGVFETGLPPREIIPVRSQPIPQPMPQPIPQPMETGAGETTSPEPRVAPLRGGAVPKTEPRISDIGVTEPRFAEPRAVEPRAPAQRPEPTSSPVIPPRPVPVETPPPPVAPAPVATVLEPEVPEQRLADMQAVAPAAMPQPHPATLVPAKPVAPVPEIAIPVDTLRLGDAPPVPPVAPPLKPGSELPGSELPDFELPDFELPDFDELAALARDNSRNPQRQAPPVSKAADVQLLKQSSARPPQASETSSDAVAPPQQRNWPGPLQASEANVVEPATRQTSNAEPTAGKPPARDMSSSDMPITDAPARQPPKRSSFEDVSKRLQEALRRPQSLTPAAITTSTARATAVAAPIQPAPFSPIPPGNPGEKEPERATGGQADVSEIAQGQAPASGGSEGNDELDLEQEMARLLGRSPGSRQ